MAEITVYLVRGDSTKTEFDEVPHISYFPTEERYTYSDEFVPAFHTAVSRITDGKATATLTTPPKCFLQGFYTNILSSTLTNAQLESIFENSFEVLWDEQWKEDITRHSIYFKSGIEIIDNGCRNDNDGNLVLRDGNDITATPYTCEADSTPPNSNP